MPTDFSTCANEEIIAGTVNLQNYNAVVWILGDESTLDETFSDIEQQRVQLYLQNGGKLFVSGSEIAWDLDRPSGPTQADRDFLHNFLKAAYAGDDAAEYSVNGTASTLFYGISLRYGQIVEGAPYDEDYPDFVTPQNGSAAVLHYGAVGNPVYAAVAFKGMFPGGTLPGAVVYVAFPFETITTTANRDTLMRRAYQYFDVATAVEGSGVADVPVETKLFQNYPNPFNPTTNFEFRIANSGFVSLKVFDLLGREVATLVNEELPPGEYRRTLAAQGLASGTYYYRLQVGSFIQTKKMLLLR
ncbi:MAG: T9SS type A sorting domain-containing protein [bacterium]